MPVYCYGCVHIYELLEISVEYIIDYGHQL